MGDRAGNREASSSSSSSSVQTQSPLVTHQQREDHTMKKNQNGFPLDDLSNSPGAAALPRRHHHHHSGNGGGRTPPHPLPPPPFSPFNSGRTVPSKWEDAERWICSPVTGPYKNSQFLQQRNSSYSNRPKSKSGPLGLPGATDDGYGDGNFSPAFMVCSPFSTGVIVADEALLSCVGGGNGSSGSHSNTQVTANYSNNAAEASGGHEWSVVDEKHDDISSAENEESGVSRAVSRRDMATQMSPAKSSTISSSPTRARVLFAPPTKLEVRDVLIDKRSNVISWSKRHASRIAKKSWIGVESSNGIDQECSSWDIAGASRNMSRSQREEAKIAAWENLQRAKAEAAIRKLEMKLEKKRSSSMDRIMNKLRRAELKAQTMRASISQLDHHSNSNKKPPTFTGKLVSINFLPSCLRRPL